MTDIQELIERAKEQRDRDAAEHCPAEIIALQDEVIAGLEALQAENERLTDLELTWRICHERSSDAAQDLANERDALQAKLDELQRQEPVAWTLTEELTKQETTTKAHLWFTDPVNCMWSPLYASPKALAPLTADDVGWVVNDLAELGVKIGDQFFFLYKGNSLVYEEPKHGDGTPMKWRPVGKREFGECCYPIKFYRPNTPMRDRYTDELMFIDGLSFGAKGDEEWRELPLAHGIGGTP